MNAMKQCLLELDVQGAMGLWAHSRPGMPQPKNYDEAEVLVHHARTQLRDIPLRSRAYSHAWLTERNMPSGLPDELKPHAERLYPRIVDGVGISVKATAEHRREEALALRSAMSDAVAEAYADGRREPEYVRRRMAEARDRFFA